MKEEEQEEEAKKNWSKRKNWSKSKKMRKVVVYNYLMRMNVC